MLIQNLLIFGVFDGHGFNGENLSNNAKMNIPAFIHYVEIENNLNKRNKNLNSLISSLLTIIESGNVKDINIINYLYEKLEITISNLALIKGNFKEIQYIIKQSFYLAQNYLVNKLQSLDPFESGSTVNLHIMFGKTLYIANIGDSRSILCSRTNNYNEWKVLQLTHDHKPDAPEEKERILSSGGYVYRSKNEDDQKEYGPYRVWNSDDCTGPGLAMSRSYGDAYAHTIGVVEIPDVFEYQLSSNDKIIVAATDGIWEFLSNDDVMNIVTKDYDSGLSVNDTAADLIKKATSVWKNKSSRIIDDITCVVLYLNIN